MVAVVQPWTALKTNFLLYLCVQQWKMPFFPEVWGWLFNQNEAKVEVKRKLLPPFYCAFFLLLFYSQQFLVKALLHSFLFPLLVQWQLLFLLESALGTTFICDVTEKHFISVYETLADVLREANSELADAFGSLSPQFSDFLVYFTAGFSLFSLTRGWGRFDQNVCGNSELLSSSFRF